MKHMSKRSHTLQLNVHRSKLEIFVGEKGETYAISITLIFNLLPWNRTSRETRDLIGPFMQILPAMIALSAVQSSAETFIHNAILFIDTVNNAWYNNLDNHDAIFVDNC